MATAAAIGSLLVAPLASQDVGSRDEGSTAYPVCPTPDTQGATCFFGRPLVVGAPFSADAITTWTPPARTRERQMQTSWRYYRNRDGYTRVEQIADGGSARQVIIANAAHTYVLIPATRTAVRHGRGGAEMIAPNGAYGRFLVALTPTSFVDFFRLPRSETFNAHEEALGESVVAGLPVTGTRFTGTYGPGGRGTPEAFTLVDERWVNALLKLVIYERGEDPYMGVLEHRVVNVVLSDPPGELFDLPAGYVETTSPPMNWRPPYNWLYIKPKPQLLPRD